MVFLPRPIDRAGVLLLVSLAVIAVTGAMLAVSAP